MKRYFVLVIAFTVILGLGTSSLMAQKKSPEDQFAKMDKNGDKKLSLEEFIGKKKDDKAGKAKQQFAKVDKDADQFVTLDEFRNARKKK